MSGLYPFYLLGSRRAAEKAGTLGLSTFLIASLAFLPAVVVLVSDLFLQRWSVWGDLPEISQPLTVLILLVTGIFIACFTLPFLIAGASDLFFRNDWRANSMLLVSPLGSKELFFGKLALPEACRICRETK